VLDASPYEGADTIHDMNTPVPEAWHGRYDVVIDSGSLEDIFNFPVAIANLANMLRVARIRGSGCAAIRAVTVAMPPLLVGPAGAGPTMSTRSMHRGGIHAEAPISAGVG
jgi:hypothetical protein